MQDLFYGCLIRISGFLGLWFFKTMAWCVATGFFIFYPRRVAVSIDFYHSLFPERGIFYHILCAWRQFHAFPSVFLDRWLARSPGSITYSQEGLEHLEKISADGTGGIMLMSHLGNWDLGATYLVNNDCAPAIKLLLYLGEKQGEGIERRQKKELALDGVRIITAGQYEDAPFSLIEGMRFLKDGGFVSMTGDRLWNNSQRSIAVTFLGREARIPASPFEFALLSGAPLIVFFINRIGSGCYHCTLFPPFSVAAESRAVRREVVARAAQHYADLLENMVKRYPFEWYHFERFIHLTAS